MDFKLFAIYIFLQFILIETLDAKWPLTDFDSSYSDWTAQDEEALNKRNLDDEGNLAYDYKMEDSDYSLEDGKSDEKRDLTDAQIDSALSKLSPNELSILDKIIAETENEENLRETRSNKNHQPVRKVDDDDDDDYDDYNNEEEKKKNVALNEKQCFNGECKAGCTIRKFRIRGKRSNENSTDAEKNENQTETNKENPKPDEEKNSEKPAEPENKTQSPESTKKSKRSSGLLNEMAAEKIREQIQQIQEKVKRESERDLSATNCKRHHVRRNAPYYNSMLGPHLIRKRESPEDPKSTEHIKLLMESFPNPQSLTDDDSRGKSFQADQPLIRVKRDD